MTFRSPFSKNITINPSNYLEPKLYNFKQLGDKPQSFYNAIDNLDHIRQVLLAVRAAGRLPLDNLGNYVDTYMWAVQWLNFQRPLDYAPFGQVNQIAKYDDIDQTVADGLNDYTTSLLTQLRNNNVDYKHMEDLQAILQTGLADSVTQKIEESFDEQMSAIIENDTDKYTQDAILKIEGAQAIASWSIYYEKRVAEYSKKLVGEGKYVPIWHPQFILPDWSRFSSLAARRFYWFLAILIFVIISYFTVRPISGEVYDFGRLASHVAILAALSFGYSFANKNYRIYSNILEQYKHREIVAKTIQGIAKNPDNSEIAPQLLQVAANTMFEQKVTGHLTKNEAKSTNPFELIGTLINK